MEPVHRGAGKKPDPVEDEGRLLAWVIGVMRGRVPASARCYNYVLLQHRELILRALQDTTIPRADVRRARWLSGRLPGLFQEMAKLPCDCQRSRSTLPQSGALEHWPHSLGVLATRVIAWHHEIHPSTARRQLLAAQAERRQVLRMADEEERALIRSKRRSQRRTNPG